MQASDDLLKLTQKSPEFQAMVNAHKKLGKHAFKNSYHELSEMIRRSSVMESSMKDTKDTKDT